MDFNKVSFLKGITLSAATMLCVVTPQTTSAVGLGSIELKSHLNEPFHAEVALVEADGLDAAKIMAELAPYESFLSHNLPTPDFLNDFDFKIIYEQDKAVKIKISSLKPVREPFVDFLMQLNVADAKVRRQYTVLLDPAEYVPPKPQPKFVAKPTRARRKNSTVAKQADKILNNVHKARIPIPIFKGQAFSTANQQKYGPLKSSDTMWSIAKRIRPNKQVSIEQTIIAIYALNPRAFVRGDLNVLIPGRYLVIPTLAQIKAVNRGEAYAEVHNRRPGDHSDRQRYYANKVNKVAAPKVARSAPAPQPKSKPAPTVAEDSTSLSILPPEPNYSLPESTVAIAEQAATDMTTAGTELNTAGPETAPAETKTLAQMDNTRLRELSEKIALLEQNNSALKAELEQRQNELSQMHNEQQAAPKVAQAPKPEPTPAATPKAEPKAEIKIAEPAPAQPEVPAVASIKQPRQWVPLHAQDLPNTDAVDINEYMNVAQAPTNSLQDTFNEQFAADLAGAIGTDVDHENLSAQIDNIDFSAATTNVIAETTNIREITTETESGSSFWTWLIMALMGGAGAYYYHRRRQNPAEAAAMDFVEPALNVSDEQAFVESHTETAGVRTAKTEQMIGDFDIDAAVDAVNDIETDADASKARPRKRIQAKEPQAVSSEPEQDNVELSLSEIDIHINYERYELALSMLKERLTHNNEDLAAKVRMLEIYKNTNEIGKLTDGLLHVPDVATIDDPELKQRLENLISASTTESTMSDEAEEISYAGLMPELDDDDFAADGTTDSEPKL